MSWCVFCGKQQTCWTCKDKARKAAAELDAFIRQEVYPFLASTIEVRSVEMGMLREMRDEPLKGVVYGHWHMLKRRPFGWL